MVSEEAYLFFGSLRTCSIYFVFVHYNILRIIFSSNTVPDLHHIFFLPQYVSKILLSPFHG